MRSDFVDFLRIFHFQREFIQARANGDELEIVANGPQVHVMGVRDLRAGDRQRALLPPLRRQRRAAPKGAPACAAKIERLRAFEREPTRQHPFEFFDFGVRRRFSRDWQREVVAAPASARCRSSSRAPPTCCSRATLGLVPIGTMAHEYLQTYQSLGVRLRDFQSAALEDWVQEYRGDLGIALTDVVGMDAFLADFDLYFAKLFDGLRHDSGDPVVWGEKALAHYDKLRIDAHTKRLVFSDGLTSTRRSAVPPLRRPHPARLRHRHQPDQRHRPDARCTS